MLCTNWYLQVTSFNFKMDFNCYTLWGVDDLNLLDTVCTNSSFDVVDTNFPLIK